MDAGSILSMRIRRMLRCWPSVGGAHVSAPPGRAAFLRSRAFGRYAHLIDPPRHWPLAGTHPRQSLECVRDR